MGAERYIHSFAPEEQARLIRQARFLAPWTLRHLALPAGARVLEAGCGVGAQMALLLERFPGIHLTGIDLSAAQLAKARSLLRAPLEQGRVQLAQASVYALPFPDAAFDAVLTFWVLEHLPDPEAALRELHRVIKPGGRIVCTEVFNSGLYAWPPQPAMERYWREFNRLQVELGGNPDIGLRLGGLLTRTGYCEVELRNASPLLDQRLSEPAARAEFVDFWHTLLLSGADKLRQHRRVTESDLEELRAAFHDLRERPDALFRYEAYQAEGRRTV